MTTTVFRPRTHTPQARRRCPHRPGLGHTDRHRTTQRSASRATSSRQTRATSNRYKHSRASCLAAGGDPVYRPACGPVGPTQRWRRPGRCGAPRREQRRGPAEGLREVHCGPGRDQQQEDRSGPRWRYLLRHRAFRRGAGRGLSVWTARASGRLAVCTGIDRHPLLVLPRL